MKYAIYVQTVIVSGALYEHYRLFPSYAYMRDVLMSYHPVQPKNPGGPQSMTVKIYHTNRTGTTIYRCRANPCGAVLSMDGGTADSFFRYFNYQRVSPEHGLPIN